MWDEHDRHSDDGEQERYARQEQQAFIVYGHGDGDEQMDAFCVASFVLVEVVAP